MLNIWGVKIWRSRIYVAGLGIKGGICLPCVSCIHDSYVRQ